MHTQVLLSAVHAPVKGVRRAVLKGWFRRLAWRRPRHTLNPDWSHVPDRVWRRHSAMLTFRHEVDSGGH